MRYLIYTETFPSNEAHDARQTGIGRYCADIGSGLRGLGHEVLVLTGDQTGIGKPGAQEFELERLGPTPQGLLDRRRQRRRVLRRVRRARPDFLLVGDPIGHQVMATGWALPRGVCPIVHGTELSAWGAAASGSHRSRWRSWMLRRYLGRARAVVCNSRFSQDLLHRLGPRVRRECVVYPCVNQLVISAPRDLPFREALSRRVSRSGGVPTVLLTVARISERKNQLRVIDALAYLQQHGVSSFHYFIVGNVDAEIHRAYFDQIKSLIRSAGLQDRVTVVHQVSDAEKVSYLDACDVFVMLSRSVGDSVEGFGISVIEASCRGKPVVVSDQGGMPETVIDGVSGRVVRDDVVALAEVLKEIGEDAALRERWGDAGRRFALEHFTPAASAARLHACLISPAS